MICNATCINHFDSGKLRVSPLCLLAHLPLCLRTMLKAALAAVAFSVACGDDNDPPASEAAGGAAGTIPVTQALLDSLPAYEGATLVREWVAEEGRVQVREYAWTWRRSRRWTPSPAASATPWSP